MINNLNAGTMSQQQLAALATLIFGGGGYGGTPIIANPGGSGGGGGGGASSTTTTTGTPIEIQLLLSAIPIVEDGQVIRSDHHNLVRAALVAIAERLGVTIGGPVGPTDKTLTIIPIFQPGLFNEWKVGFGLAYVSQGVSTTQGWLQVELPDGAFIKSMTMVGRRDGNVATFAATLERQEIAGGNFQDIITVDLKDSDQLYNMTVEYQGGSELNEVNNSDYKYMIDAIVTRSEEATESIQIYAIKIVYSMAG
jgi:hypothetical protein